MWQIMSGTVRLEKRQFVVGERLSSIGVKSISNSFSSPSMGSMGWRIFPSGFGTVVVPGDVLIPSSKSTPYFDLRDVLGSILRFSFRGALNWNSAVGFAMNISHSSISLLLFISPNEILGHLIARHWRTSYWE